MATVVTVVSAVKYRQVDQAEQKSCAQNKTLGSVKSMRELAVLCCFKSLCVFALFLVSFTSLLPKTGLEPRLKGDCHSHLKFSWARGVLGKNLLDLRLDVRSADFKEAAQLR